jgi:acyl-CoA synthetase (NDP forming)
MSKLFSHFLEAFMNPSSIAFYGANDNILRTMGTTQLLNLIDNGYRGRIYPIHPKLDQVLGLKAYKTIAEVPEVVDMAIVILPTKIIPQIFVELGEKGIKNIILVTAGFRENNNLEGERELNRLAGKYQFHFLGPNCIGMLNTHCHHDPSNSAITSTFNCTWVSYLSGPGNVSIISQSGTIACHTFIQLPERDLHLSKSFSVGNEANIDICDCLEYLEQDPTTAVILLYIEEIKRGQKFRELVQRIVRKKPIVALYVGGTQGGARAVSSHTGSMAGRDEVFDGFFHQTGIIRAYSTEEMFDTAMILSKLVPEGTIPENNRVAIVTNAGGPGATMSDLVSRLGLKMPDFSPELKIKIAKYLPSVAKPANPLDYTFSINPAVYYDEIPTLLAKSGEIDAMIAYGAFGPQFLRRGYSVKDQFLNTPTAQQEIKQYLELVQANIENSIKTRQKYRIPFIYVNPLGLEDEIFVFLNQKGFPTFKMEHRAVIAMKNFLEYGIFLKKNRVKETSSQR